MPFVVKENEAFDPIDIGSFCASAVMFEANCVSYEIEAFRLLTLQTAWKIDQHNDYKAVRADISAVKAMMQKVLHDVSARALQLHGSLGTTHEMPFVSYLVESFVLGLADGPTEVHKITVARQVLRDYRATADLFPTQHQPKVREAAIRKYADRI